MAFGLIVNLLLIPPSPPAVVVIQLPLSLSLSLSLSVHLLPFMFRSLPSAMADQPTSSSQCCRAR